jgi:hypothetical protein
MHTNYTGMRDVYTGMRDVYDRILMPAFPHARTHARMLAFIHMFLNEFYAYTCSVARLTCCSLHATTDY